jgi:hypothetical protein
VGSTVGTPLIGGAGGSTNTVGVMIVVGCRCGKLQPDKSSVQVIANVVSLDFTNNPFINLKGSVEVSA